VLGLGLKYTQIQVKPEESQFLATQQANVAQICRYFSVPAAMVDGPSGGGMQYSNTEQRGIEFLTYSLAHWLKRIEDAMFVAAAGFQYVKFNTHVAAAAGRGDAGEGRPAAISPGRSSPRRSCAPATASTR
jgi:phage portal protein BeeE